MTDGRIGEITGFWFDPATKPQWFAKSDDFDRAVAERLGPHLAAAANGDHDGWMDSAEGCVALCVLLDQAPRNLFRNDPRAFATDAKARAVAEHALAQGHDLACEADWRVFLYLPLEHHEDMGSQDRSVALFTERVGDPVTTDYAERHRAIIARFGRFPHRNAVLGRANTPEEAEFLSQPNSSF